MLLPVALAGCNHKTSSYKALEQERDSLLLEGQKKTAEINQMLGVMNMIDENFTQIREAENYVTFQTNQENISNDSIDHIVQDIELIRNTLLENKNQIASLKRQLYTSRSATKEMKRMVQRMSAKIEEHAATITKLQALLASKDVRIKELDELVKTLNDTLSTLQGTVAEKEGRITMQEQSINKVWYVFGTKKELRDQKIYTRNGLLKEGFNKNYFLEADSRQLTEISLYSRKAKLLTNHPVNSYKLEKVNEYLVLKITDPKKFWEISHYLVIEVN